MPKKLLIFGGSGFVGGNLVMTACKRSWDVSIADNRPIPQAEWWLVDILDKDMIDKVIEDVKPTAVVNVAAVADIDQAEREQELAEKVNVEGARYIAESCAKRGIRLVFFSSDAVFDGQGGLYDEEDIPNPINYYGRTKAQAEKVVLQACPSAAVIRISLVLGFPVTSGNSFFANLESKLREGKEIHCPLDEIRTPVDVTTLSECVLELCENDFSGVIHIGATDSINRYDLTRKITRRMGFDETLVKPQILTEPSPDRAPRHKNGIISVIKAQQILETRLLSTDEGIKRAFIERPVRTKPTDLATNLE
jgi:dTDP-4-dehydrorhamnose reductase